MGRDWVRLVSTWPTGKTQTDAICLRRRRGNRGPPAPAGSASGSNPARLGVFCEGATRSLPLRVLGADFSGREGRLDELRVQAQRGGRGGGGEALPCPGRFLAARSPRPPDRSCHGLCWPSSAGAAERDREVPPAPARHAPVRSEGKYSSRYLPGFLEVVRQRCLLKAFWNVLSACYKIVENYRVSSV